MKKLFALLLAALLLAGFAACGNAPAQTAATEEESGPDYPDYEFDLTPYIRLPEHGALRAVYDDPTVCTDGEIEEAILQVMLTYAEFLPETVDRPIELYDRVTLAYYGYVDGEVVDDLVETDATVVVGKKSDSIIETVLSDALLGAKPGEIVAAEYLYPEDAYFSSLAGKKVLFEAHIASIEYAVIPPCDDEFVQQFEEYGFETVADFREQVKRDILQQKEENKISAVWDAFLDGVEILGYPEGPMQWYRDSYEKDYLSTADEYGVTLTEYLATFLQITPDVYEKQKEEFARKNVKTDMALMQLVRESGVTLSDEEFKTGVAEYIASSGEDLPYDEFVAKHGEYVLRVNLLWDKAIMRMVENAVRVGSPEDVAPVTEEVSETGTETAPER